RPRWAAPRRRPPRAHRRRVPRARRMTRARAFVVLNPAAGGGRARRRWPALRAALAAAGVEVAWAETAGPGAATALAREAAARWPLVVAAGGDGTVNEVVNGLVDEAGVARATLGVLPLGRGGDAARNLGLARTPAAAVARLAAGDDVAVDLGRVEAAGAAPRWFVDAAGVGLDADVAARAAGGGGTLPYLLGVARAVGRHRPTETVVRVDDGPVWTGAASAVIVANGPCFGGGMRVAPAADPRDGRLDVVVLGALGRAELLWWLPRVYRGGHLANPEVRVHRARRVRVDAAQARPLEIDGELGGTTPVTFAV